MKVFITLAAAIILHGIFIYTVLLKLPMREQKAPQYMDVTLITQHADKKSKEAKSIATDNQLASKSAFDAKERVVRQKEEKATSSPVKEKTAKKVAPSLSSESKPSPQSSEITKKEDVDKPRLTPELLQQQMSSLATTAGFNQEQDANPGIRSLKNEYRQRFISKVKSKFRELYPERAASGTLNFRVGIKIDGTVETLEILGASNPEEIAVAEKTIYASAPFEPLPFELGVSVLEISLTIHIVNSSR